MVSCVIFLPHQVRSVVLLVREESVATVRVGHNNIKNRFAFLHLLFRMSSLCVFFLFFFVLPSWLLLILFYFWMYLEQSALPLPLARVSSKDLSSRRTLNAKEATEADTLVATELLAEREPLVVSVTTALDGASLPSLSST